MKPIVNQKYLLEKFPGKGGWTFARIPEIPQDKKAHFGWVMVKGTIDGSYEIKKYHLMPMGNGSLFLPVKAEIRKKIKKAEGNYVHIILYLYNDPLDVPEEMTICLREAPQALKFFTSLSDTEKKHYIQWIYSAKKDETKVDRLAKSINRLLKGKKLFESTKDKNETR